MNFIKKGQLVYLFLAFLASAIFIFTGSLNAQSKDVPKENDIIWTYYPEKNTERNKEGMGSVTWGGGSFMKLISKLAIEGCDVNAFIAITPQGEQLTHHFQAPNFVNRSFGGGNYMREVPPMSQVGFTCVDACDIYIGPGADEATRKTCMSADDIVAGKSFWRFDDLYDFQTSCIKEFPAEVEDSFFDYVSTFQDICIVYFNRENSQTKLSGVSFGPINRSIDEYRYMRHQPFIFVYNDYAERKIDNGIYSDYFLYLRTTLHELCHQRQGWYINKFYGTYDESVTNGTGWYDTKEGKDFIEVIGYKYDEEKGYYLEEGNKYRLQTSPIELAAITCSDYILNEMIIKNHYPELYKNTIAKGARPSIAVTPETMKWMEKYVII